MVVKPYRGSSDRYVKREVTEGMPPISTPSAGVKLAAALGETSLRFLDAPRAHSDPLVRPAVVPDRPSGSRTNVPPHLLQGAEFRLPDLGRRVTTEIRQQMTVYQTASAVVSREDLTRSVMANLRTVIDALRTPDSIDLAQALATGTRRARQGVPLAEVQRAFRIGFSGLWDVLLDVVAVAGDHQQLALADVATTFWYLIDRFLEAVGHAYRLATAEIVRAQPHRRVALLDAVFSGGAVTDATRWDIVQLLDLPHDGTFAVVVAETGRPTAAARLEIENGLDAIDMGSAWRSTPAYKLGLVSIGSAERLGLLVEILRGHATGRIGVSPAFSWLADASHALRLAHVALASIPDGAATAVCFDESPISMLVAAAPKEATSIAQSLLAPVLALPAADRDVLLDTVDAWVANAGSAKRTAGQLYCHPNTVRYRLQRVQTELRMSLTDPSAVAQLVVALRAWRLLGGARPPATGQTARALWRAPTRTTANCGRSQTSPDS
jgi:PucR-like helix-turn-helix protein